MPVDPLHDLRVALALQVRRTIIGDRPPARDFSQPLEGDLGLFGPESVTWKVHRDSSMLIGGVRALVYQTVHPLAMAGIAEHSAYRTDPTGRLWRTSEFVGVTTFGSTAEAERLIRVVRKVHDRVEGVAPDGRPYRANDPHLLAWVHHTEVDSFLRAYQRYGQFPLTSAEADRYIAEMAELGRRMGAEDVATSRRELDDWFVRVRPELRSTAEARGAVRFLAFPPLPAATRAPYAVIFAAASAMLPLHVRRKVWLPYLPLAETFAVRPAATALARGLAWVMATPLSEAELATR